MAHTRLNILYRRAEAFLKTPRPRLDPILVVDLEATTYADRPRNALRDVIEVGVCELALADGTISRAESIVVRPTSSEVSPFCTNLTGITPERASSGRPFIEACEWLVSKYESTRSVWASFGDFDRAQFVVQCEREGLAYPFGAGHLNIKLLAALRFGWKRAKGLTRALAALDLEMTGRHHSARDDAVNAARVLHRVLRG